MKYTLMALFCCLLYSAQGQTNDSTSAYIYAGRQDTVPCTMLVSSLFMWNGTIKIGDSSTGFTYYNYANVFQIRGYMVTPEHPSDPFFLDENKKRIELLHIWSWYPYNYHVPNSVRPKSIRH